MEIMNFRILTKPGDAAGQFTDTCYFVSDYDKLFMHKSKNSGDAFMFKILVVDDDRDVNDSVCSYLRHHGYDAHGVLNADDAYDQLFKAPEDLIISDIMMPDIDGYEFAEAIRRSDKNIPILFITARDDFASKKRGFEAGIDDYMVKPLDLDEMLLRIEALLRRAQIAESAVLDIGSVHIDTQARTVIAADAEIPLSAREFNLLHKLLSNPNKTFSRTQLMNEFWDADAESSTRTVDVYMTRIRSKFASCPDFEIVTVHGLGYKAVIKI